MRASPPKTTETATPATRRFPIARSVSALRKAWSGGVEGGTVRASAKRPLSRSSAMRRSRAPSESMTTTFKEAAARRAIAPSASSHAFRGMARQPNKGKVAPQGSPRYNPPSMTERLYYLDPYLKELSARVVRKTDKGVVLDRTAFFPTGGGQPCDLGTLNGVEVTDVVEDGNDVL